MGRPSMALMFFAFLSLSMIASAAAYKGRFVGGKSEVKDVKKNKEVQELGRFCVEEFNRSQRQKGGNGSYGELSFNQVVEAQKQVVAGLKYYLKIETVTKSGQRKVFDSVVVVRPWIQSKELLNFSPSKSDLDSK